MPIDTKHEDLQSLRIDRSQRGDTGGEPSCLGAPLHPRRDRGGRAAGPVRAGLSRLFRPTRRRSKWCAPSAETSGNDAGGTVLSATGYIVAHHKINVNSKVTGRLAWIGVEKGDKVKEGQVLVRLEDRRIPRVATNRPRAAQTMRAPTWKNCSMDRVRKKFSRRSTISMKLAPLLANDKLTLDRTKELAAQGVVSKQQLDDATAKFEADQQRANSLQQGFHAVEDRTASGGNRCAPRGACAGARAAGLRQVAARRHRHSRSGDGHDSRSHRGKR